MRIDFETHTLSNGLKVVVHQDHSVPKVVFNLLYKVGSKDESPLRTGFAHLFEHLMFEGSAHVPQFDKALQQVGGYSNAFTSADITNYHLHLPANQLETGFWLDADRMYGLAFSEEKLATQKSVVIEEYKQRYLNQPYGDAYLLLRSKHFHQHPYQWMPIGKEIAHIDEASLEEVKAFFYGFYAPNNATLVVAGDVRPDQVYRLAEKWFGPIDARPLLKKALPQETGPFSQQSLTHRSKVPMAAVYRMYHMPPRKDPGYFIADILTDLLSYGKGSLLYQYMVKETQLSPGVSAFSWGLHDPGALSISGKVSPGKSVEAYEQALDEVLENRLMHLQERDLQRIKNRLKALFVLQQVNLYQRAVILAEEDALGDIHQVNRIPQYYEEITLEEVKSAARELFAPHNRSTLYYLPESDHAA